MILLALLGWLLLMAGAAVGLAVIAPHALIPVARTTAAVVCMTAAVMLLFTH